MFCLDFARHDNDNGKNMEGRGTPIDYAYCVPRPSSLKRFFELLSRAESSDVSYFDASCVVIVKVRVAGIMSSCPSPETRVSVLPVPSTELLTKIPSL